jgi:large subunit ribosomal protein L4
MAVTDVYNKEGAKVSQVDLMDQVFDVPVKGHVMHEVVTMQLAKRRVGTVGTKGRSDVRGGGQKPYRQKGTGRARAGSRNSPLWRGGGVIFGPSARDYSYKVPKKVRKLALRMALSSKFKGETLKVVDRLDLEEPKTKAFVKILKALNVENALVVTDRKMTNVELSSRNIPRVKVIRCEGLNVYDVLKYEHLILVEPSVNQIHERLLS